MGGIVDSAGDELLLIRPAPGRLTASTTTATITAGGNGAAFSLAEHRSVALYADTTMATGTLTVFLDEKTPGGGWVSVSGASALLTITAAGAAAAWVGPGLATNVLLADTVRLRWAVAGGSPSFTLTLSVIGE
jgi:hypothetical protein